MAKVAGAVQQLLDEPAHVHENQPLMTAGLSSMLAVELTSQLEAIFSLQLPGETFTMVKFSMLASHMLWKLI